MTAADVLAGRARWHVEQGDALEALRTLPDACVDALVTDPPAGIAFMGKAWDGDRGGRTQWVAWLAEVLHEALRTLKPGAYGLVWALPRTSHWTAAACEDARFDVRDVVTHLQAQGYPKSSACLKPSAEHWILVRKPGAGALQIDRCRIATDWDEPDRPASWRRSGHSAKPGAAKIAAPPGNGIVCHPGGRWPANAALTHAPDCDGECAAGCPVAELGVERARFFFCAKATRKDRGEGNAHSTVKSTHLMAWLCRLIAPPGGIVLDPFAGSGSTGVAALREGLRFIGIESTEAYVETSRRRLADETKLETAVQP